MSEDLNNAPQGDQAAANVENVDTQSPDTQSVGTEETTKQSADVTDSLKIETPTEPEKSETSQPSIDDIVAEALSGELSEETQKLIDENGLGKHIEMLVAGNKAIQEKNNQEIFSVVGGEQSYKELQEWGKNNMTKEEQAAFNEALFSGNMSLAKLAVQGLKAQYVAKNGKSPDRVIEGGGTANEVNRPFSSQMEYIKATQTLQYKQNPEYRREVENNRNISGF